MGNKLSKKHYQYPKIQTQFQTPYEFVGILGPSVNKNNTETKQKKLGSQGVSGAENLRTQKQWLARNPSVRFSGSEAAF